MMLMLYDGRLLLLSVTHAVHHTSFHFHASLIAHCPIECHETRHLMSDIIHTAFLCVFFFVFPVVLALTSVDMLA
jgi:hypothetical protein